MNVFIGTSGFSYKDWIGKFYPKGTKAEDMLKLYAQKLPTVELNVTFYRTPKKETFESWYSKTPADFHFVIKGSQIITHFRRLRDVEEPLQNFLVAAQPLKEKLKVILWQLPPKFPADAGRLEHFLRSIETLSQKNAAATKSHKQSGNRIRHAFEFRDPSWLNESTYKLLRDHNVSLVFSDHPVDIVGPKTTDFLYIRRHGPNGDYHVAYPDRDLVRDVDLIKKYNTETYEFFNNDSQAVGADNALTLTAMLQTTKVQ